ncbi:DUF6778 family protein [Yoonia sediminilitoris]|uniref:Lipoprotein n=1 Tax=Yoonia sediminilitoris TaxID=1286148 RepID=A0A2T6KRK4_9RHOB|nr:DUF6778 family protein [Yoonia sediminilitoris]PUB19191.1 hypothetical protein C8N45_101784 [Yoonia sediminilitoris]RCW99359.1 hypothetical protein DFP92_101784 [Yoonia sediminilitoris]
MKLGKLICLLMILVTLGACTSQLGGEPRPDIVRNYALRGLTFSAVPDLVVSEEAALYPIADVVWRGDPPGPRIAQIEAMFETAVARNRTVLDGPQPIIIDIQLIRFHGVTERTRYSVGGIYNIIFSMTVRDAGSGAIIEPARVIAANLDAPGGSDAIRLERSGQTEKVRVTEFLSSVLQAELL